jgi:glycosyltransferase involved in cell wall biosynthesis
MVSTEYPPMQGGVGRYTFNLAKALRKLDFEVNVVCNRLGNGEFSGLSPENLENSSVLLDIVEKMKPDLVHVQYEHGLYGLKLDPINPRRTSTNIDLFYKYCQIPIVTTFHSAYPFKQWLNLMTSFKDASKRNMLRRFSKKSIRYWKMLLNYYSFHNLNKEKLAKSEAGIVFSQYMTRMIGGCEIILHGAEPSSSLGTSKKEARKSFNLP